MDTTVDPCDKFYQFSCGGWLQQHKLSDDKSLVSTFENMKNVTQNDIRNILEEKSTSDENPSLTKAKQFYKSCINMGEINARGDQHFKDFLRTKIHGRKPFDLTEALITSHRYNLRPIVSLLVGPDQQNSSRNLLYIDRPEFGMERLHFLAKKRDYKTFKSYETYIYKVAEILGFPNNVTWADVADIVDFEIQIVKVEKRKSSKNETDKSAINNPMTLAELHRKYSSAKFSFDVFIKNVLASPGIAITNITDSELVFNFNPAYFQNLKDLITETPNKIIANYVTWRFTQHFLEALPQSYRNLTFEHKKVLEGIKKEQPIWKTCLETTNKHFGYVVAKPYVERYFDDQEVFTAKEMIRDLHEAFEELLEENEWMDDVTKKHASEKTKAMKISPLDT
jgi:predicted metalloendopeptidase